MNNSWGSYGDEGDGLTLFEQAVSSVAGQGAIAIFAAGNSENIASHATSTTPPAAAGKADTCYLRVLACDPLGGVAAPCVGRPISIWADPNDTYTVALRDDGGDTQTWTPADLTETGTAQMLGTAASGGSVRVVGSGAAAPGGFHILFDVPPAPSAIAAPVFWTITMTRAAGSTGTGAWDAYLGDGDDSSIAAYDSTTVPPPADPPLASRHVTPPPERRAARPASQAARTHRGRSKSRPPRSGSCPSAP